MEKAIENSDLVGLNKVAQILGVTKDTLRNWDNSGILKAVRVGNRGDRRYRKEDIEKIIKNNGIDNSPEIVNQEIHKYLDKGEFWFQEAPGTMFTLQLPNKYFTYIGRFFKPGIKFCAFSFTKDYFIQVLNINESIQHTKAHLETLHNEPKKMEKFINDCKINISRLEQVNSRMQFVDLVKLSKKELLKEYYNFNKAMEEFWIHLLFIEHYDPYTDNIYIYEFEKIIGNKNLSREIFSKMTFPDELSFVASERYNFLRIINKYFNAKEIKILNSQENSQYLGNLVKRKPGLLIELKDHVDRYFWTQMSYAKHTLLDIHNFIGFLRETLKDGDLERLRKEFNNLENQGKSLKSNREEIIKKYNLSKKVEKELELFRTAAFLKDERKKNILVSTHHLFRFAKEFSKRSGVDIDLILFARIREIADILENNLDLNKLQERREDGIGISWEGKQFSIISGNEARMVKEKLFPKKDIQEHLTEIHGTTASKGDRDIVTGKVRVIFSPDGKDITENEILVTPMTRPEFMPLMKKALAFVTDEGGITCHAAIVSRELNKPCIIGTKNSTRILQDGDIIEMRLNHGIVKILKRKG